MIDYIIVGLGLGGIAVAEELEKRGRRFIVFDDASQNSSYVAGGVFNPVILKRFTLAWKADEQLKISIPVYKDLEQKLEERFIYNWDIYRRFHSVEEQNNWFVAGDKPRLQPFLDPELKKNTNPNLNAPFSLGRVRGIGNIDTETLLDAYRDYLEEKDCLRKESFLYENLVREDAKWHYDGIEATGIIFCEGFGIKKNPFFNYLPLRGNKGEYMTIYAEDLDLDFAVKSNIFLVPVGNHLYKVGATYDPNDKTPEPTVRAREKLTAEVKALINCDFEVVDQVAGLRPSVVDRRPLVGKHPERPNLFCCNGFGSRGVLLAPAMSKQLIAFIEDKKSLDPEADLDRFTKKYYRS
ncbi:FAD-dependent oxidoreductase [Christiangramia fulva]|uniref:FAD-dependent oxidoreductase n=1 Tax=Christiangramia fulva TaxID=2126553 RepID=A0A2R3Z2F9_9FLAO|nr:FAD-binding oxidoreductase [Christiangramia fulva]AVR44425.1 FAD-dependent oxidoreductase [Christiangramia fulva]